MPTTCGFPNCRFRSRYRGAEDNRHFYRVPKKPAILRKKWLEAIGRTEETIVSQLRVCSGHFFGGEKNEGDVPVADPAVDEPIRIELPPKIPRFQSTVNKRNCCGTRGGGGRGRGLHHTQGVRNRMCFFKPGMLNYMTKHNNCLNMLETFKQKYTVASSSTHSSPTLRNEYKMRINKPADLNTTSVINDNNDMNNPLMWFNNLYSPHIYDCLKTLSTNTSTSSLPELNTNRRYSYNSKKHFNPNSVDKDQSILHNYSYQSSQEMTYPMDKYTSLINTSCCRTPLSSSNVCLPTLTQNEHNVLKTSCSSPFNSKDNKRNNIKVVLNDDKPQSAFSSVTSILDCNSSISNHHSTNINLTSDFTSNNNHLMQTCLLSTKEQFSLNSSTENAKNKFTSTISSSSSSTSNLSTDYFLSLASAMNGVLTNKFTENYLNSSKFPNHIQHYQTNLKDECLKMNIELCKQNYLNNEYNHLSNYPLNTVNSNTFANNIFINELNEIKDLSIKSEYISNSHTKNNLCSSNHYDQNDNRIVEDMIIDNVNICDKFERTNETVPCNPVQLKGLFAFNKSDILLF
ncbi:unnamed protein product [Schistosoma turkestanicum]|nr:unnamed protein product [Schistosoma turkestanicum]